MRRHGGEGDQTQNAGQTHKLDDASSICMISLFFIFYYLTF